jgi:DNA-binding transcriptional ArsR family regulator
LASVRFEDETKIRERIERGLGSKGKLRIIRELAKRPEILLTKYALERKTGLKPVDVRADLKSLLEIGWVIEHRYRITKYQLNLEDGILKEMIECLRKIGYLY